MLAIFKASSLDPLYVDISPSYILGKPNMTRQQKTCMEFGCDTLENAYLGGQEWAMMKLGQVTDRPRKISSALLTSLTSACGDKSTQKGVRRGVLWSQLCI